MRIHRAVLGVAFTLALAIAPGGTVDAHPTTFSPPAEDLINGCENGHACLYPHWDPRYFWQCDQSGACKAIACPDKLFWNQSRFTCDWLASRTTKQSGMTTSPAKFHAQTRQIVGMSADIGLIGEKVTFTTKGGAVLCSATTGKNGIAKCDSKVGLKGTTTTLTAGFIATYEGNGAHQFVARKANGEVKTQ